MARDSLKTLFHPFASGSVAPAASGERYIFLGAEAGYAKPEEFAATIVPVQGLRPLFRQLEAARLDPLPVADGEDFDGALILCGKHRGENENRIAIALERVKPSGLIVIAGGKEDGIQSMRKLIDKLGLEAQSMPKYHGIAIWFHRPADSSAQIARLASTPVTIDAKFQASAGMFSHAHVDPGSELLAGRLPADFDGNAADFGAGWGYLSVMLGEQAPRVNRIDLFEANYEALEAAKKNLARNCPNLTTRFFWQDLAKEAPKEKYDMVIMNPPFHEGHEAEPELGQVMIKTAADSLRGGGRLLLVANRGLPYESVLAAHYKEHGEVCRNSRFKVLWARK